MRQMNYYEPAAWLVLACLLLLLIVPAGAGSIDIVPTAITINCTIGDTVTRTAVISATDDVTGLNLYALDMLGLSGATSIPPPAIRLPAVPSTLSNGSIEQVPIGFDFKNATGGIYSGEVWVSSSDGIVKIPVTATVRAGWLVPAFILIAAVILSYWLFTYGSSMKRRDEIERSLEIIQNGIDNSELTEPILYDRTDRPPYERQNPYYCWLKNGIESVQQQIDFKDTNAADTAYKQLAADLQKWKASRGPVKVLFENFTTTIRGLNTVEPQILSCVLFEENDPLSKDKVDAVETARKALQDKFRAVVPSDDASVDALKTEVGKEYEVYKGLEQAVTLIKNIDRICKKKGQDNHEVCKGVPKRWNELRLKSSEKLSEFIAELNTDLKKLELLPSLESSPKVTAEARGEEKRSLLELVGFPEWVWTTSRLRAYLARFRLFLYEWGSFLVMIVVLAATGYSLLYLSNPTFGASIDDYLTLALWGLLVGPTADAVSQKTSTRVLA